MPANKNAMTRYALIDKMLANRHRAYSIQDITDELAERLPEFGQSPVSKRCVEKDINYITSDSPFDAEIEEFFVDAADRNGRPYPKRCLRYADPTFSIFKPKLTEDEKSVLAASLDTLGSFEGLESFEWLSDLRSRLNLEDRQKIISLSKNLLTNSSLLARLFTAIRLKRPVKLGYHTFSDADIRHTTVSPHLLKEYNNRWFLIASACDSGRLLTFALDRIDDFVEDHVNRFIMPPSDVEERYEDIVGVTYAEDEPLLDIIFRVSDNSKRYVDTKPIHDSQIKLPDNYPDLDEIPCGREGGWDYFKITCRVNYELISVLTSFGPELVVLSPKSLVDTIKSRIAAMNDAYRGL